MKDLETDGLDALSVFKTKLGNVIASHPIHNLKTLSEALDKSPGYVSGVLKNSSAPSWSVVVGICRELGISPNELSSLSPNVSLSRAAPTTNEIEAQAERLLTSMMAEMSKRLEVSGSSIDIKSLLVWWAQSGGRLSGHEVFAEDVDVFNVPEAEDRLLTPHRLGANSVASRSLTSSDPARLRQFLETLDPGTRSDLVLSYRGAYNGPSPTVLSIDVDMPDMVRPLHLQYCRLLLPVTDAKGNEYILNYSELL